MKKSFFLGLAIVLIAFAMTSMAGATMVANWGFDETGGTTAYDSVGSVDGTLVGGAAFTTSGGIKGGAIEITTGYVDMGNHFAPTSTFSIQAWVKTTSTAGMTPVAKHRATYMHGYLLTINNIGDGCTKDNTAGFYSANGPYDTAYGPPAVNDGDWHMLVGVYENGTTYIYIDGQLSDTGSAGYSDADANFIIGGLFSSSGTPYNAYQGFVDEVAVYDTALNAREVQDIYNSTINPVPLPPALLLFGSGIAVLAGSKIRKKER